MSKPILLKTNFLVFKYISPNKEIKYISPNPPTLVNNDFS